MSQIQKLDSNPLTFSGETHYYRGADGQLYQVVVQPAAIAHQPQPQAQPQIQPESTVYNPSRISRQEKPELSLGFKVFVGFCCFVVGAVVLKLLITPFPQNSPVAASSGNDAYSELLRSQNAQLREQLGEIKGQNSQLQQQLQAKPSYERHCEATGLFGWGRVCNEIRR